MKRSADHAKRAFCLAAAFFATWTVQPMLAQEDLGYSGGLVDDWTHHHVVFSNPGTMDDMYPAKYTFAPIVSPPSCTNDFVIFL